MAERDRDKPGRSAAPRERIVVPAREGRVVKVKAGQRFGVVDLEGAQIGDLFAFSSADVSEYASAEHTRVALMRLFPRVGDTFVTNRRRHILSFEEDRSPGYHDMLCAACDPTRYAALLAWWGGTPPARRTCSAPWQHWVADGSRFLSRSTCL